MACLLTLEQIDRRMIVGVFEDDAAAIRFLEPIPGLRTEDLEGGYCRYTLATADLPDALPIDYNGWQVVISRFTWADPAEEPEVEAVLTPVSLLDTAPSEPGIVVAGQTVIDTSVVENSEVAAFVERRERFCREAEAWFAARDRTPQREGLGTEDGEYIIVTNPARPNHTEHMILFDPATLDAWEAAGSFDAWMRSQ